MGGREPGYRRPAFIPSELEGAHVDALALDVDDPRVYESPKFVKC